MLKMRLQCDNKTLHRYHRKNTLRCFLAIYDGTQINQAKGFIVLYYFNFTHDKLSGERSFLEFKRLSFYQISDAYLH